MSRYSRFGLTNARRKYLHYNGMVKDTKVDAEKVAYNLKPIVEDFEAACDRIDDLTTRLEKLQEENRRLLDMVTTPTPFAEASA